MLLFCPNVDTNSLLVKIALEIKSVQNAEKNSLAVTLFDTVKPHKLMFFKQKCGRNIVILEYTKSRLKTVTERR